MPFAHSLVVPPPDGGGECCWPPPGFSDPPVGAVPIPSLASTPGAPPGSAFPHSRAAAAAPTVRRSPAASPPERSGLPSSEPRLLHAARGAASPLSAAAKRFSPFALPRTLTLTEPVPNAPAGRTTAMASRPRFAEPVTATAAGAFVTFSVTFFFGTVATATATWPSAGIGILIVAAWLVAAHRRQSRSTVGRRRASMAATVRPLLPHPHRGVT